MLIKLSWTDLIIEDLEPGELLHCLRDWAWLASGQVAPVFLSRFGDWFLRRPEGSVLKLDVLGGTLTPIASNAEEFRAAVNGPAWQEEHLHAPLIYELHRRSIIPGAGQCYAVAPHPVLGGRLEPPFIMVLDVPVWQSICVQSFQQAKGLSRSRWWQFWRRGDA